MTNPAEIEAKFWKALKSDRTLMLGLSGVEEGHSQPMTAQIEGEGRGSIWIFTAKDTEIVEAMGAKHPASVQFVAKDHALFATLEGTLVRDDDRSTIERLWNPFVAAWFKGGKDDPNLQLLRFDPQDAQIWLNENSLFAVVRLLLGGDPKKDYQDKVASVNLS